MENRPSSRAGRYVSQPTGYRAFIPGDLPPSPPITVDDEMLALLSQADRSLGRLDGSTEILPNPDLFVAMYVRKEAVLSSQIEGTQASLLDVLEFEAKSLEPGRPRDVGEVVNYVGAMNHGLERLKEFPLSLRLIREIHEKLLSGVRGGHRNPGEFRTTQNWIGPHGAGLDSATFVPPPPQQMHSSLHNFEKFLHDPNPMPVLMKVGIAHAQFETIHPFLDGNGRLGRLLITFLLCEKGIMKRPLLYLSFYFKQHRSEYYDRLQSIRDDGNWEGWLKFFLKGVYDVAQEATNTARQIVNMREAHRQIITKKLRGGGGKAPLVLESLFGSPLVTVKELSKELGLSYSNANALVDRLCDLEILKEITGQRRNRIFTYESYLSLFKEQENVP